MATELLVSGSLPPIVTALHATIFGSTLIVYNLPRLLPRPYGRPRGYQPYRKWYFILFFTGLITATPAFFMLPPAIMELCAVSGIFSFAYFLPALPGNRKRLRDFGLLKIFVLTSVWVLATTIMPLVATGSHMMAHPYEITLRFVFIFALCVLFDIRDMDTDTGNNIATLPHHIGETRAYRLVDISLILFMALALIQYIRHPDLPERLIAAIIATAATWAVARFVRRHPGHWSFVLMTDGMMLLYAVLLILLHL